MTPDNKGLVKLDQVPKSFIGGFTLAGWRTTTGNLVMDSHLISDWPKIVEYKGVEYILEEIERYEPDDRGWSFENAEYC